MKDDSVKLCEEFFERWKESIEQDENIVGGDMVDEVVELYWQIKEIEKAEN